MRWQAGRNRCKASFTLCAAPDLRHNEATLSVTTRSQASDTHAFARLAYGLAAASWAAFLLLTSAYALLAYLPYTFYALVKAPPYDWLAWFAARHSGLYWGLGLLTLASALICRRGAALYAHAAAVGAVGAYLYGAPVAQVSNDASALRMAFVVLLPVWTAVVISLASLRSLAARPVEGSLPFSRAVVAGVALAALFDLGTLPPAALGTSVLLHAWSVVAHVFLAVVMVGVLNLARKLAARSRYPAATLWATSWALLTAVLWHAAAKLLSTALSFEGLPAQMYALALGASASALVLGLGVLLVPTSGVTSARAGYALGIIALAAVAGVRLQPAEHDWNNVVQGVGTALAWGALAACLFLVRPRRPDYSVPALLAVLLVGGAAYSGLYSAKIFWGAALGPTDEDIVNRFREHARHSASFRLAQFWLDISPAPPCGELCQILRQHTNIRDAVELGDVRLVEQFAPRVKPPHLFVLVVDSLRPDYLGAYNPKVDFTPNFDAFARDSLVVRNVYAPYTGTTLSEPALWAGMQLLHTHYPQPFAGVNNLERLLHAYDYRMYVSMDTVLRELLTPSPHIVPLDAGKKTWNRFEGCSTFAELRRRLEERTPGRPVFFYAQPVNIHQFAVNDLPPLRGSGWVRPGFSERISYRLNQLDRCFGELMTYLKRTGLYDDSIIVVTSDHGEGSEQLGRSSHSLTIYPEMLRIPLLIRLPQALRARYRVSNAGIHSLTDLTPTLYHLLGNTELAQHPLVGRSVLLRKDAPDPPRREQLLVASDVRAVYGLLTRGGEALYVVYDSPPESFLFDLASDPDGTRNLATDALSREYNRQIVEQLQAIASFYGYRPRLFHSNPETGQAPTRAAP